MESSRFDFTMTMPGDARLVGAVRDLAVHAAKYAQLPDAVGLALADHAAGAAATNIDATRTREVPVEVRFTGERHRLEVHIACEVIAAAAMPSSISAPGVSIAWTRVGARQICLIAHQHSS